VNAYYCISSDKKCHCFKCVKCNHQNSNEKFGISKEEIKCAHQDDPTGVETFWNFKECK
jgi:hypothetical protein